MKRLVFVIASVLIAGLLSCNKEPEQLPNPAKARAAAGSEAGFPPGTGIAYKRYQLRRLDEEVITYNALPATRICKTASNSLGNTIYEYNDTPGNKSIKTSRYLYSKLVNTSTFLLNDNGLCYRSDHVMYTYDPDYSDTKPALTNAVHTFYGYTNDRLYTMNSTREVAFYSGILKSFGAPLTQILFYNANGELVTQQTFMKQKKISETIYTYGSTISQPNIEDKLQLNPEEVTINPYLKVFGSFNEHLLRSKLVKYYDGTAPADGFMTTYDYILNDDGYVTSRKTQEGQYTKTDAFDYLVSTRPF